MHDDVFKLVTNFTFQEGLGMTALSWKNVKSGSMTMTTTMMMVMTMMILIEMEISVLIRMALHF